MTKLSFATRNCAVARSLDIVGEWWSMMIILELFCGTNRFDEFQQNLGISRSILTNRLAKLLKHDLVKKLPLNKEGKRQGYFLTDKGRALLPAVVALHQWGNQWLDWPGGKPLHIVDDATRQEVPPLRLRSVEDELLQASDIRIRAGDGADDKIKARFGTQ